MAGYFTSTLFGDITLSTLPHHGTPDMFSWFPIYFPFEVFN
jgi:protein arginine N-methyltransferase 5